MPLSRKKACFLCRESKARCDRTIPECSRCAARKLRCVYDGRDGFRTAGSPYPYPSRVAVPQETIDPVALLGGQQPQDDDTLARLLSETQPRVDELADDVWTADALLGGDTGVDPLLELDLAGTPFALGSSQARIFPEKETISPGLMKPWGTATDLREDNGMDSQESWIMRQIMKGSTTTAQKDLLVMSSTTNTTATTEDSSSSAQRALLKRPMFRTCTMSSILLGQVTSYPKMMIEGDRLPPFIHAPCHIDNELAPGCGERGSHQCLPRELAICASLVQLFYERTKANADFVWTSIYGERDRLQREVCFTYPSTPRTRHV